MPSLQQQSRPSAQPAGGSSVAGYGDRHEPFRGPAYRAMLPRRGWLGLVVAVLAAGCGPTGDEVGQGAPAAPAPDAPAAAPAVAPPPAAPSTPTTAPQQATQPTEPATVPQATAAAGPIHFQVVGPKSRASYTTREKFFNRPLPNFASGATPSITGDIYLDPQTWQVVPAPVSTITVDISTLESDQARRDRFIRRNFLESATFPKAVYVLKRVVGIPASYMEGSEVAIKLEGDLTVREITKPVTWEGTAQLAAGSLTGTVATAELQFADFGIPKIRIAMLEVEDWFKLEFQLTAARV